MICGGLIGEMTGHEIRIQGIWGTDQLLTGAHGNVISQEAATYKAYKHWDLPKIKQELRSFPRVFF
jgi:hypothetical protein